MERVSSGEGVQGRMCRGGCAVGSACNREYITYGLVRLQAPGSPHV